MNTIEKYSITFTDIYNFDETGFIIGTIVSKIVVTGADRYRKLKSVQPRNWEWVIVIQAINTEGWAIQPFIMIAG